MSEFIKGLPELRIRLAELAKRFPKEAGAALYQEALKVEKLSRELTPVLYGALRGSHVTSPPTGMDGGKDISVMIQVGGPAAGYAVYVHENLDAYHKVGQAKFLEAALNASVDDIRAGIADRLRSLTGGTA